MKFGDHVEGTGETLFASVRVRGVYLYRLGDRHLVWVSSHALTLTDVTHVEEAVKPSALRAARKFAKKSLTGMREWMPLVAARLESEL